MRNNWLENYKIKLSFNCNKCKEENLFNSVSKNFDTDKNIFLQSKCIFCGSQSLEYIKCEGEAILSYMKEEYEQNGRKAIRTRLGNGRVTYHSMTREKYEKTGDNQSVYAKGFKN